MLILLQIVTQTSTFHLDANGKLIIPEYATIVQLTSNGLVLPLESPNTASSPHIYFALNNS